MTRDNLVPLLTPEEVCEWLQVKKSWLYDNVEAVGGIPHVKLGNRTLRFRQHDVEAWMDSRYPSAADIPPEALEESA